jgi:hypothetical protein
VINCLTLKRTTPTPSDLEAADLGGSIYDEAADHPAWTFEQVADKQVPGWRDRPKKFQDSLRWHFDGAHK